MKKIIAILFCCLLGACARQGLSPLPTAEADRDWAEMAKISELAKGPYRLQLSMRFGEEGDTRRVTALLWGNDQADLRLDVMAGVGATIAKIADTDTEFLAYLPREHKAYVHQGAGKPLLKVGVPVPFGLAELAALLNGRYTAVFGSEPVAALGNADGNSLYELQGPLAGTLVVGAQGQPLSWTQAKGGWKLDFGFADEKPGLPVSLKLNNLNGRKAIILVKEREAPAKPFSKAQLTLELPQGTARLPLSEFRTAGKG